MVGYIVHGGTGLLGGQRGGNTETPNPGARVRYQYHGTVPDFGQRYFDLEQQQYRSANSKHAQIQASACTVTACAQALPGTVRLLGCMPGCIEHRRAQAGT